MHLTPAVDPHDALRVIARLATETADHTELCALGIKLIEPLVDCNYEAILDEFIAEMRANRGLRQACSCANLQIPDDLARRVYELIGSDEDIGREQDEQS